MLLRIADHLYCRLAADLHFLLHNDRAALILRHTVYDYLVDFTGALRSPIYA